MNLFDNIVETLKDGFIKTLNELQVEPSIVVSKKSFNSERYTVLFKRCLCESCGGVQPFHNIFKDILTNFNANEDVKIWVNDYLNQHSNEKVNTYLSIDFGNKDNHRHKVYFEKNTDKKLNKMPFYQKTGNNLRIEPDIVSAEWNNNESAYKHLVFNSAVFLNFLNIDIIPITGHLTF